VESGNSEEHNVTGVMIDVCGDSRKGTVTNLISAFESGSSLGTFQTAGVLLAVLSRKMSLGAQINWVKEDV
jgi:hypothetical protein